MWENLPIRSLIDWQRQEAIRVMGEQARALLAEGYAVDADRVLDEMAARMRSWKGSDELPDA